jgi:UDPglucose 6-dehydrogenase
MEHNITRISKRPGDYATYEIRKMITDKVGIIGLGFVGSAINSSLEMTMHSRLTLVDPAKGYTDKIEDCVNCTGIFVCVPSPMGDDGSCDTSILESVLTQLKDVGYNGVIISKCTAPPDVYERLNAEYPNLVHAPEFLTAANAVSDYENGSFAMIGGRVPAYQREAERIIRISQSLLGENVVYCSIGEAALAKYTINSFLATKVIFMNEIYNLSQKLGLRYEVVAAMYTMDPRIGKSHTVVPGPDGAFGFGGACFPKDTAALLKIAEQHGSDMMVLDAAVKKNTLLRLTEPK